MGDWWVRSGSRLCVPRQKHVATVAPSRCGGREVPRPSGSGGHSEEGPAASDS